MRPALHQHLDDLFVTGLDGAHQRGLVVAVASVDRAALVHQVLHQVNLRKTVT